MRILILGAGGVGGYVGAKLLSAGGDVVFLARGSRFASLRSDGLRIESALGDISMRVRVAASPPDRFDPDLAVIACKAPALDGALDLIAPALRNGAPILPFLNGVAHLDAIARKFAHSPIIGGIAHGALTLREDGAIAHLTPFFSAIVGPLSAAGNSAAQQVTGLFATAHVDVRLSENIIQDLWGKYVFITTLAGATCLMRASIGAILASDGGEDLIAGLLAECLAVARAEGIAQDKAIMAAYRRVLVERGSALTSSMLRDVRAGSATEANHILGDMVRRARKHAIATPILDLANAHLQCYEAERAERLKLATPA